MLKDCISYDIADNKIKWGNNNSDGLGFSVCLFHQLMSDCFQLCSAGDLIGLSWEVFEILGGLSGEFESSASYLKYCIISSSPISLTGLSRRFLLFHISKKVSCCY